jgi:hypothetical protein
MPGLRARAAATWAFQSNRSALHVGLIRGFRDLYLSKRVATSIVLALVEHCRRSFFYGLGPAGGILLLPSGVPSACVAVTGAARTFF